MRWGCGSKRGERHCCRATSHAHVTTRLLSFLLQPHFKYVTWKSTVRHGPRIAPHGDTIFHTKHRHVQVMGLDPQHLPSRISTLSPHLYILHCQQQWDYFPFWLLFAETFDDYLGNTSKERLISDNLEVTIYHSFVALKIIPSKMSQLPIICYG